MVGIPAQILSVLSAFPDNPQQHGRRLRELLDEAPTEFLAVARSVFLENAAEQAASPQARFLLALLSSHGHLLKTLREVDRVDHEAAVAAARQAHRLDPSFERMLARQLLEAERGLRSEFGPEFLLSLLEGASGGLTMLPSLGQLRNSEDPRVRSSMALLLGKSARAQDWFRVLRDDPDPRVRANAIESLWGQQGPFTAACFESGAQDRHPRVVANSWLGLYLQGDAGAVAGLAEMVGHADPHFRMSGLWAVGRSKDPRFLPLLRDARPAPGFGRDVEEKLALAVTQAIGRIHQGIAAVRREPLHLRVWTTSQDEAGNREAIVLAANEQQATLPGLLPAAWRMKTGGRPVWRYGMSMVDAPSRLSLGIVLPFAAEPEPERDRGWSEVARRAFCWRRRDDPGAIVFYSETPHPHFVGRTGDILKLSFDAPVHVRNGHVPTPKLLFDTSRLVHAAQPPESFQAVAEGPVAPVRALASLLAATHRDARVILVLDHPRDGVWEADEMAELTECVRASGVVLHCVATPRLKPDMQRAFQKLALGAGGYFVASPMGGMAQTLSDLVSSEYRHFRLTWRETEPTQGLEVEVRTDRYRGKVSLASETSHCGPKAAA